MRYTFVPAVPIHGTELTQKISGYFPFAASSSRLNHSFCRAPIIDFAAVSLSFGASRSERKSVMMNFTRPTLKLW